MFQFKTSQKVFEIGNVKIGGQPGKNPTVLIGSLFYHGQKLVLNEKKGEINEKEAEALINFQEKFSDITGNPCMIDLVGTTDEAIKKMLDFVSDITETPILIDSPDHKVKIAGTLHAAEIGILEKVIYNSLIPESKPEEYEAIKETKLESAILLAYQKGFMTSKGRVEAINELYPKAVQSGIKKPIVDAFVIDVPTLSMASRAIIEIKKEMGLPCGCGAHNAISTWSGFKKRMGKQAVTPCTTVVNTFPVALGADFILYGPLESCKYVFPAVSTLNSSYKFLNRTNEMITM